VSRTDASGIDNLAGWLTPIVSRVCLDMLRSRRSLGELPLPAVDARRMTDGQLDPEQQAALDDTVAGALYVVLDRLTPAERVAVVLHDLFGISVQEISRTLERTPAAARQLASRARRRMRRCRRRRAGGPGASAAGARWFPRAARDGDIDGLLHVLAPDVVCRLDHAATALNDVPARIEGATNVASTVAGRAQTARTALIDSDLGIAVQSEQRTALVLRVTMDKRRIAAIEAIGDPATSMLSRVAFLGP
jgi:RNA polymerase sigma factor (sigma-70 family)